MSEPAGGPVHEIEAVIFDMDGVLIDSEQLWDEARERLTAERGGRWHGGAQRAMMGMSSTEWSQYMHDELGVADSPEAISTEVVRRLEELYRRQLPIVDGAVAAVEGVAERWPLAVASSSNRPLIDLVLELSGLAPRFAATVSSEEVARGKPEPDVYLAAAAALGIGPSACVAIEDSSNGLRAAARASMRAVAIPNHAFPPAADALDGAAVVLASIGELTPALVESLG